MNFTQGDEPSEFAALSRLGAQVRGRAAPHRRRRGRGLANDAVANLLGHPAAQPDRPLVEELRPGDDASVPTRAVDAVVVNNIEVTVRDAMVTHAEGTRSRSGSC